jgi:hypothetical protein
MINAESVLNATPVSRIVYGRPRLMVESVALAPVVEAAIGTIRRAAEAKRIQLQVVLDSSEVATVHGVDEIPPSSSISFAQDVSPNPKGQITNKWSNAKVDVACNLGPWVWPSFRYLRANTVPACSSILRFVASTSG